MLSGSGCFAGVFLVMALIELVLPKRQLIVSKGRRWLTNLGISVDGRPSCCG